MPRRSVLRPVLHIAGPGAGKTYGMVQRIVETLPVIAPNRYLAVVTYTNAAVDSISRELMKVTSQPANLFIGTNHAFFNHFILQPYGHLFGIVPKDCVFSDVDVGKMLRTSTSSTVKSKKETAISSRAITNKLVQQGVVPFGEIVSRSAKLIKDKRVRNALANRLQAIFIDEFQDLDIQQYEIINRIRTTGRTRIYAVGDPEQYITQFTYGQKHQTAPPYERIPFFRFERVATVEKVTLNRRSSLEIVMFSNQLHSRVKQTSERGSTPYSGVFFLNTTSRAEMVGIFRDMVVPLDEHLQMKCCRKASSLTLAKEIKVIGAFAADYGLIHISNDRREPTNILREALRLMPMLTGKSLSQWGEEQGIDRIEQRKLGLRIINAMRHQAILDVSSFVPTVYEILGVEPIDSVKHIEVEQQLQILHGLLTERAPGQATELCSTIHKAKGLEADAVLVVAKTRRELEHWITTDVSLRIADKTDICRVGYVGFTRARDILCIACLQDIDDPTKDQLAQLGVLFRPEKPATTLQMTLGF